MAVSPAQGLLDKKPVKLVLAAWLVAATLLTVLISGERFFERFEGVFGPGVKKAAIALSNQVREESAARPLGK